MEAGNPLLDDYALSLVAAERPRVCFLPTASGDADHYIVRFYRAFAAGRCEPSHVSLFRRDGGTTDVAEHLLRQDVVYVGGGSVISLLGAWRAHGIDLVLRAAWESGVVMTGLSAGSLCWFSHGVTAFHGEARTIRGLGLLPWSNAVHYDEEGRRGAFRDGVATGELPTGYASCNGAALHFVGTDLARAVSSRETARAYRVTRADDGLAPVRAADGAQARIGAAGDGRTTAAGIVEDELACEYLGALPEPALVA